MSLPSLQENHFHYLLGTAITLLVWLWLRGELTPDWVLSLFCSEGKPSVRLVSAFVVLLYTLLMQAKGRLSLGMVEANYLFAGSLYGFGTVKLVGKAIANRRPPATTVQARVEADTVNMPGATLPPE